MAVAMHRITARAPSLSREGMQADTRITDIDQVSLIGKTCVKGVVIAMPIGRKINDTAIGLTVVTDSVTDVA